jgi:Ni/Co efflux regulator RcnB
MQYRGVPYPNGARPSQQGRPGDQRFRDRDRGRQQYDQRNWRPSYRPQQRYRAPAWRPPIGFYAYNWRFGDYLPGGWFGSPYYLNWGSYGLPLPPIGCEWVRVGDDAVLVDTFTGRVLSVAYDIFW